MLAIGRREVIRLRTKIQGCGFDPRPCQEFLAPDCKKINQCCPLNKMRSEISQKDGPLNGQILRISNQGVVPS